MMLTKLKERRSLGRFDRAKKRLEVKNAAERVVRIGFVVDATASRQWTWEQAQRIQADMFKAVAGLRKFELRLVHFTGLGVVDHGWTDDPDLLTAAMADVQCVEGYTRIMPALKLFLDDGPKADVIILTGDSCEEHVDEAMVKKLKQRGIKLYCFLDRSFSYAVEVYQWLADETGGIFAKFGDELSLADLCEGVALIAAGGKKALRRSKNKKVRLLLAGPAD